MHLHEFFHASSVLGLICVFRFEGDRIHLTLSKKIRPVTHTPSIWSVLHDGSTSSSISSGESQVAVVVHNVGVGAGVVVEFSHELATWLLHRRFDHRMTVETDKQYLWVEKYRPKTIEKCILPEAIKKSFRDMWPWGIAEPTFVGIAGVVNNHRTSCSNWMINCSYQLFRRGRYRHAREDRNFISTVSLSGEEDRHPWWVRLRKCKLDATCTSWVHRGSRRTVTHPNMQLRIESSNRFTHDALVSTSVSMRRTSERGVAFMDGRSILECRMTSVFLRRILKHSQTGENSGYEFRGTPLVVRSMLGSWTRSVIPRSMI